MDYVALTQCPVCGATDLEVLGARSDNLHVLQCQQCMMGFVEKYPVAVDAFYTDNYYQAYNDETGYQDYQMTASHSLAWTAYFIQLWNNTGNILDVGCADGYLLQQLGNTYSKYGIEVNSAMAQACQAHNINVIETDIQKLSLTSIFNSFFQVITGIAVLEHVQDIRLALENIRDMLTDDGIFLFEVPLISKTADNSIWFRSSLEHIYYPTIDSIYNLFTTVFDTPLLGQEVQINEYGSTFFGVIARSKYTYNRLKELYDSLFSVDPNQVDSVEGRTFRFLFDVVHRADTQYISVFDAIDTSILSAGIIHRLMKLWQRDAEHQRLSRARAVEQATQLQEGLEYYRQQSESWRLVAQEQIAVSEEYIQARDYHSQQSKNWQSVVDEQATALVSVQEEVARAEDARNFYVDQSQRLQAVVDKQVLDIHKYIEARDFFQQQAQNWQSIAEKQNVATPVKSG